MKCDICGKEYAEEDLKKIFAYRKAKYMCYKCERIGSYQARSALIEGIDRKKKKRSEK